MHVCMYIYIYADMYIQPSSTKATATSRAFRCARHPRPKKPRSNTSHDLSSLEPQIAISYRLVVSCL